MEQEWKKKLLYGVAVAGLIGMYATYVPFLMDYYTCRPEVSFVTFFDENLLNATAEFESMVLIFVLAFLFCVTWNSAVSVGLVSLLLLVLTHASYIKYVNRQELLRLADFKLTEAAGMAAGYLEIDWSHYLATLAGGLLLFSIAAVGIELIRCKVLFPKGNGENKRDDCRKVSRLRWGSVIIAGFVAVGGVVYTNQYMLSRMDVENADNMNLVDGETDRHVLYYLLKNDSLDSINVENAEESYEFLLSKETPREAKTEIKPNVIVVMNESWWNTDNIATENVVFSKDPMEPYKELEDECITGYLSCNVYGGGTVSSEAEFLTGINTKYYLSSSAVYSETMGRKLPSVVDYFNALDYETIAIHPYYGEFYGREKVYDTMGFDETVFDEDMKNREVYTRYISDESLAKEIIEEYEEAGEEERKFIWSTSISNHRTTLEYHLDEVDEYDYPISVELKSGSLEQHDMETFVSYINGIYLAGEAYADLIEYFSEKEEPVIVVMYGDHMPNFAFNMLDVMGLTKENEPGKVDLIHVEDSQVVLTEEQKAVAYSMDMLTRVYTVPVIMWSNFELEETPDFDGESIYYLPGMILESAGLPDSEMSCMLRGQRNVFKANSRKYVLNEKGERIDRCSDEELEMMNHGKVVGYDILFGEEPRMDIWLPISE